MRISEGDTITFDHSDHPDYVSNPEQYPLIVSPIIKDVKLNRVLINGDGSLSILFLKTFDQMELSRSLLRPSRAPFHGIVPGAVATSIRRISLPLTFRIRERFRTKTTVWGHWFGDYVQSFIGMANTLHVHGDPTFAYLVLKMSRPRGVISIRGDVKQAFHYDRESCEIADRLMEFAELQELKQALAESPLDLVMPKAKTSKMSMEDTLNKMIPLSTEEPSKIAHVGNNLDPK
jgi:hypothetical protein